jgi:hypothetical protein
LFCALIVVYLKVENILRKYLVAPNLYFFIK